MGQEPAGYDIEFCGEDQNWRLDRYTTPEQWRALWGALAEPERAALSRLAASIQAAAHPGRETHTLPPGFEQIPLLPYENLRG